MAPIKDSDLFLINQGLKTYKVSANDLAEYVEGEIQLPESLFKFVGNIYFDEDGDAWEQEEATDAFFPPEESSRGDIFVCLPTTVNPPVVPTEERELNGWYEEDGAPSVPVKVRRGSLIVCNREFDADNGKSTLWTEIGSLDYALVDSSLQSVLEQQNNVLKVPATESIKLNDSSVVLTKTSADSNFTTTGGDIVIGTKGDEDSNATTVLGTLSVPNIDFERFATLPPKP